MPRVAAHAAVTSIHDAVANDDALDGDMFARAAFGALVIDTESAVGKKVSHQFAYLTRHPDAGG